MPFGLHSSFSIKCSFKFELSAAIFYIHEEEEKNKLWYLKSKSEKKVRHILIVCDIIHIQFEIIIIWYRTYDEKLLFAWKLVVFNQLWLWICAFCNWNKKTNMNRDLLSIFNSLKKNRFVKSAYPFKWILYYAELLAAKFQPFF